MLVFFLFFLSYLFRKSVLSDSNLCTGIIFLTLCVFYKITKPHVDFQSLSSWTVILKAEIKFLNAAFISLKHSSRDLKRKRYSTIWLCWRLCRKVMLKFRVIKYKNFKPHPTCKNSWNSVLKWTGLCVCVCVGRYMCIQGDPRHGRGVCTWEAMSTLHRNR